MPISDAEYCTVVGREACTGAFWRDVIGELLATFFLVSVQCALPLNWDVQRQPGDVLQTGLGMAFVVIAIGWGWGDFGGAHMNPAITMAFIIRREITFMKGLFYWIMQCAAAIAAAFFVYAITPDSKRYFLGATFLTDVELWQGFLIEFWISLILIIAVVGSLNRDRKPQFYMYVIPIGLAIALGHFVAFSSTGASMNPARSLGPAVVVSVMGLKNDIWDDHWVYWAGPMAAAIVGALVYMLFDRVDAPKMETTDVTYVQGSSGYSTSNSKIQADRVVLNNPNGGDAVYNVNGVAQRPQMGLGTSGYPARYW